ncbi:hypothetical protein M569_16860, partial [Genlisea aurea]
MNDLMTKSFLNYVDLKKQAMKDLESGPDLEMGQQHLGPSDHKNLSKFFEEVDAIRADMEELKYLLVDLQELNESTKSAQSSKILRGLRDRINSDMVMVLRKAKMIKSRLESLEQSNLANRTEYKEGSYIDRTRNSVTNGLKTKLKSTMNDFQSLREKVVSDHKQVLKRRYYTATGNEPTDEIIEKMASDGGIAGVFEGKREIVEENHERHEAVKAIQRSLVELQQLFLDMAVMVETQGEQMDDIETNVVNAGAYVNEGTKELDRADKLKKQRARACWIGAVILVIVLVIIL